MSEATFISRFTPSLMPNQVLEALFVKHETLAARLLDLIQESGTTEAKQQTLLIGPRGAGKTFLVTLTYGRLQQLPELMACLRIAWLREEEWGISSFLDLLLRILTALAAEYDAADLEQQLGAINDLPPQAGEQVAVALLDAWLEGRVLLLLLENLDVVFKGLGDRGQKALRSYMQERQNCTILATAQSLFNGVSLRTSTFYGFFRVIHLEDLNLEESLCLLTKIARHQEKPDLVEALATPRGRARVRAVRHLAGSSPRIMVIFSEFLTCETLGDLIQPLLSLLDDLTPYYQSRMRELSNQQGKIVSYLCDHPGSSPVKNIARGCLLSQQVASSQLGQLAEKGYVRKITAGRESYYELAEPLLRFCLAVKRRRGQPLNLLIDFLRGWYSHEELEHQILVLSPRLGEDRIYLHAALASPTVGGAPSPATLCMQAYQASRECDDWPGAVAAAQELIALADLPNYQLLLGQALARTGDLDGAVAAYECALTAELTAMEAGTFLAGALAERYALRGTLVDLARSIALYDEALTHAPVGPDRVDCMNLLAIQLGGRYERLGNPGDLQRSIALLEEAAACTPTGPARVGLLNNLGNALGSRYDLYGDPVDLERWLLLLQDAVELTSAGPERGSLLNNLATALGDRFALKGDPADLDQRLVLLEEALALTPPFNSKRASILNNLGNALSSRYTLTGASVDMERAVALLEEALLLTSSGPYRGNQLNNLASALGTRFAFWGNPADLDRRITLLEEALDLTLAGSPSRAGRLSNLAIALGDRYMLRRDPPTLAKSISLLEEALDLTPAGPERAVLLNNLGNAVGDRYVLEHDRSDLQRQLDLLREALRLTPTGPNHAGLLHNLSNALNNQYVLTSDPADLEMIIALLHEAVTRTPTGPERCGRLNNLGNALISRFALRRDRIDLDRGITYYEEALALTPADSPSRIIYLKNLAGALGHRYYNLTDLWRQKALLDDIAKLERIERGVASQTSEVPDTQGATPPYPKRYNMSWTPNWLSPVLGPPRSSPPLTAPDDHEPQSLTRRGIRLYIAGRFAQSLVALEAALRLAPDHEEALAYHAPVLYALGRTDEALAALDAEVQHYPNHGTAYYQRAVLLSSTGRYGEALENCEQAIATGEVRSPVWFRQAACLLSLDEWDQGMPRLGEVLARIKTSGGEDDYVDGGATEAIVTHLLVTSLSDPPVLTHIAQLVEQYGANHQLELLGAAVLRTVPQLMRPTVGQDAVAAWLGAWHQAGQTRERLALPLRLLAAAVRYRANQDPRILLELPSEERSLLAPLLGSANGGVA